jgi:hypothetical protein
MAGTSPAMTNVVRARTEKMKMTGWTFGQVKARGLCLEGYCQTEGCGHFYTFDIDTLVERGGADYPVPEFIPNVPCAECGGQLKVFLAAIPSGQEDEEPQPA